MPETANDLNPKIVDQMASLQISMPNNRPIDPNVLTKIRELATNPSATEISTQTRPNPLRAKSGLWFRDIIGRASPTKCISCNDTAK